MKKKLFLVCGFIALSIVAFMSPQGVNAQEKKLVVRLIADKSIANRINTWGKVFTDRHPNYSIALILSDVEKTIEMLFDGKADLCLSSRPLSRADERAATEKNAKLAKKLAAYDGIIVMTHPEFPVAELPLSKVKAIFSGEYANWSQVGGPDLPISVWAEDPRTSHLGGDFNDQVMRGAPLGSRVTVIGEYAVILKAVSTTKGAISYCSHLRLIDDRGPSPRVVRMLGIKKDEQSPAVVPSEDTIEKGTYPLRREYYFYWDDGRSGNLVKPFVDFVQLGKGG